MDTNVLIQQLITLVPTAIGFFIYISKLSTRIALLESGSVKKDELREVVKEVITDAIKPLADKIQSGENKIQDHESRLRRMENTNG
jgi:hypothetical protein